MRICSGVTTGQNDVKTTMNSDVLTANEFRFAESLYSERSAGRARKRRKGCGERGGSPFPCPALERPRRLTSASANAWGQTYAYDGKAEVIMMMKRAKGATLAEIMSSLMSSNVPSSANR